MKRFSTSALVALGCAMASAGVAVDAAAAENSQGVNMSNIDTSTEGGADRLLRRIRDNAQSECAVHYGPRSPDAASRDEACMRASMARTVSAVSSTLVTARFGRVGADMILAVTSTR
jgi:UrcA family protein